MLAAVERGGAVAAITAVVEGTPAIGLNDPELERFLERPHGVAKLSARDIPWAMARGLDGATTVAASLVLAARAGITTFATGGIGGVHRAPAYDESADLLELARSPLVVVCAGAKSVLDVRATYERLETLGVLVVGYRTSELPGFFTRTTGVTLSTSVDSADEIARIVRAQRAIGARGALLVVQPPPADVALARDEVASAVLRAEAKAHADGVGGGALTPYLLAALRDEVGDRVLRVNLAVLEQNAGLAADIAGALATPPVPRGADGASGRHGS